MTHVINVNSTSNIASVVPKGRQRTYDLEVEHPDHQFYLANGILTSNSHSVAYAIDSYYAAWLMTYHEKDWLATCLQTEQGKDGMTKTISEIKALGYKFAPADVNFSGQVWEFSEEVQAFVPPLASLKSVGDNAMQEIVETRPYRNLDQLLFDSEGQYYHSKVNKTVLSHLCMVEAFSSLEEFKTGRLQNHRQLHEILVGHAKDLRKGRKGMTATQVKRAEKKGTVVPDVLDGLIRSVQEFPDWSRTEKLTMWEEITKSVPAEFLFPDGLLDKLNRKGIRPITDLKGGEKGIAWLLVRNLEVKVTKTGKEYTQITAQDGNERQVRVKVWGKFRDPVPLFSVWIVEATGDDKWGPSVRGPWNFRPLDLD